MRACSWSIENCEVTNGIRRTHLVKANFFQSSNCANHFRDVAGKGQSGNRKNFVFSQEGSKRASCAHTIQLVFTPKEPEPDNIHGTWTHVLIAQREVRKVRNG